MEFAIAVVSICPMRLEPSHRSEMVSQLLFGEFAEVLEVDNDFVRIRCLYDGYEGWCQSNQLEKVTDLRNPLGYVWAVTDKIMFGGLNILVPFATPLYGDQTIFGSKKFQHSISSESIWKLPADKNQSLGVGTIARRYLGTPYLWGGKSLFGIDCSGFVQQVYKFFDVPLLRDAYLQAEQGTAVTYSDINFGDLAFFQNENQKITHVGLMLDNYQIIHASGRVRIDELKEDGIYNSETGKRTHVFHSMRRVLDR